MTSPNTRDVRLNIKVDADGRVLPPIVKGLDDTAKAADKAGDSLKRMGDDAKSLNVQVQESEKRIAALRKQMVETGGDKDVRRALRGEESWLRELTRIQRADLPDPPSGRLMTRATGPLIGAAALGIAAAAPALGAIIAGAVAGTIGTGGVLGGIAMASKDPRVRASAQDFGAAISKEFFRGGEVFVGPTQEAMKILLAGFKDMQLPETFAKMAPHVTTIATGLADLGRNVMPGLNKAFDRMGPFADAAAAGLADTGSALGQFMDDVTGSKGTLEGLQTFFFLLNSTIRGVGGTLAWLGDRYDESLRFTDQFAKGFEDLPGMLGWAARQARENIAAITADAPHFAAEVIEATDRVTTSNKETAESWKLIQERIRGATQAQNEYFNRAMAVPEANDALEASFDAFTESLKENGRTFDSNTEKGRANRDAFRDMITAAQDLRTAQIESGQSTTDVNRQYQETIAKIEAMATKAGLTAAELREMAGDYYINIYRREVTHKVTYFENHDVADTRKGYAHGGTTPSREPFWVGEKGPELMFQDRSHFVATAAQSKAITSGGGTAQPVQVYGGGIGQMVFDWLEGELRHRGLRLVAA